MNYKQRLVFSAKLLPLLSENCNSVICPYGIATVLSMVAEGASQESLDEILFVLGFEDMDELREAVLSVQAVSCSAFSIQNELVFEKGIKGLEILSNFRQIMDERYKADIEENDSLGEAHFSLRNIANFKAEWLYEMERDTYCMRRFLNSNRKYTRPAFLQNTSEYPYYFENDKEEHVEAIAIPYKLDSRSIPYELVLINSSKDLTAEVLENIFKNMSLECCNVIFPEFSIKNEHNLIPVMNYLGAYTIFSKNFSGFDKITTQALHASTFFQKAEIVVDEKGTVAVGETEMECSQIGDYMDESIPKEFVFDKPFYYFLRNTTTGEIIFMGKVNNLKNYQGKRKLSRR